MPFSQVYQQFNKGFSQCKKSIAKAIQIYNEKRPHRSLNMMMPVEAHQMNGPIPKRWKKSNRADGRYREQAREQREAERQSQKNTASEKKKAPQF